MKLLATCAALVFGGSLAACKPTGPADPSSKVELGKPAPEIRGDYVRGDGPKTLAEAKGTVVLVDFWGTFCEPCKKSFPKLQDLVDTQGGKLALIAVSNDDPEETKTEDIVKFADDYGKVSFPIVWDKDKATAKAYGVEKMPTSFVIDKQGNIRHVHGGYHDNEAELLAKETEALIEEN